MTVTAVHELWQGRDGDWTEDQRSYTRVFRAETNDKADHAGHIESYIGIPKIGEPFPADHRARCVSVSPRSESHSPYVWLTTCVYRSKGREGSAPEFDPTDDDTVIRWNTETYQRPCPRAYWTRVRPNGQPNRPDPAPSTLATAVVNSAGDPFDPPWMVDDCRFGVTVIKNLSNVPAELMGYVNAINDEDVVIDNVNITARRLKVMSISISDWKERNWTEYREVAVGFSVATTDHVAQIVDQGFREDTGTLRVPERTNIENADGSQLSAPVLLDGAGRALEDPSYETAVFLEFGVYPEVDFNALKALLGF